MKGKERRRQKKDSSFIFYIMQLLLGVFLFLYFAIKISSIESLSYDWFANIVFVMYSADLIIKAMRYEW